MRLLIIFLLASFGAFGQTFQNNNTPTKFVRGLKADSLLIIPIGCDTPLTSNPKWGTATDGALFLKTCDTTLWVKIGQRYIQVNGTASITGGDTTIFATVLDSTGQINNRVLFARNNKISSSPRMLFDSARSKLVINNANSSAGGNNIKLFVDGQATFTSYVTIGQMSTQTDTSLFKPMVSSPGGGVVRIMDRWPVVNDPAKLNISDAVLYSFSGLRNHDLLKYDSVNNRFINFRLETEGRLLWNRITNTLSLDTVGLGSGSAGWGLSGNSATSTDFIGTTNTQDFIIKNRNIQQAAFMGADSSFSVGNPFGSIANYIKLRPNNNIGTGRPEIQLYHSSPPGKDGAVNTSPIEYPEPVATRVNALTAPDAIVMFAVAPDPVPPTNATFVYVPPAVNIFIVLISWCQ